MPFKCVDCNRFADDEKTILTGCPKACDTPKILKCENVCLSHPKGEGQCVGKLEDGTELKLMCESARVIPIHTTVRYAVTCSSCLDNMSILEELEAEEEPSSEESLDDQTGV